jgi:hypothetical protein
MRDKHVRTDIKLKHDLMNIITYGMRHNEHVTSPEPAPQGGVVKPGVDWSRGTCMWQIWSPPKQGGGVQSHGACGNAGARPSKKTRSGAAGHVAASEPSRVGRRGPKLRSM